MPGWYDIVNEIQQSTPYDIVRRKYITRLSNHTKRNVICYYSGFLTKQSPQGVDLSLNDHDLVGFMNAVKDMDVARGLDLILHTPGGSPTATEAIVKYLRAMFKIDIRIIVPQLAMSAGTMVACSGREIVMGKQSSLGPIDPQISGIAAFNIKKEYEEAKKDLAANPQNAKFWALQLSKYPPAIIHNCINAIDLSADLVTEWLKTGMFYGNPDADTIVENIVKWLNQNEESKIHGRHFDKESCKAKGLKIYDLEDDNKFQDCVLSVHHCYMALLSNTSVSKIIENQKEKAFIITNKNEPLQR